MKARYFYLIALVVVVLDQLSKLSVVSRLPFGRSVPVIDGLVHITAVRNPGGAFGLFQSWAGLLTLITIAVVAAIVILVRRAALRRIPAFVGIALALQLGGAVGNLIDRVRFNYVVDFIDLRVWPVFNLADSAITVGIVLLAYYLLFCDRRRGTDAAPSGGPEKG